MSGRPYKNFPVNHEWEGSVCGPMLLPTVLRIEVGLIVIGDQVYLGSKSAIEPFAFMPNLAPYCVREIGQGDAFNRTVIYAAW